MKTRNTFSNSSPKLGEVAAKLTEGSATTQRSQQTPSPLRGTPPNLGGEFKLLILALFAVLCSLYSCTSEDEAPSNDSRTVTVQLHANAKPMFVEGTESRTTTGAWETGDEVVAMITVGNYFSFATLQCTGNDTWKVTDNYVTQYGSQASDPYYDYHLLAKTEGFSLNEISVRLPEDVPTDAEAKVELTYAPDVELITKDENGNKWMSLDIKKNAMTNMPEEWLLDSTNNNGWTTFQARIRIHTGVEGQEVTMTEGTFVFKATTNTPGNAFFYIMPTKALRTTSSLAKPSSTMRLIPWI